MIVSKALRNIRQKIDYVPASASPPVLFWWNSTFEGNGTTPYRVDTDTTQSFGVGIGTSFGGQFTDDDWSSMLASSTTSLVAMRTYALANRTDISVYAGVHASVASCARLKQEYDGRYLLLEYISGTFITSVQFDRIYIMINNVVGATAYSTNVPNIIEITAQELIAMGIPLVLNANSSYSFPAGIINNIRIKLSEDV